MKGKYDYIPNYRSNMYWVVKKGKNWLTETEF